MSFAIIPALKVVGDIGQFALPIGVGLHALYKGHREEGVSLGVTAGVQQIVLNVLKSCIEAPRPFPNHLRLDSFPSGHAAAVLIPHLLHNSQSSLTLPS